MKIIVCSDFHLSFNPKTKEEFDRNAIVLDFLTSLKGKTDMLILAGDIFDLWYDWKSVIVKGYFPFLKKLADLSENGCKLVFIAGNHDFWFGNFMEDYLNCTVCDTAFTKELDGKKLFVSHGDLYTINDKRYRTFHTLIRHPVSRFLFSIIHPNIAMRLGMLASRTSRARNNKTTNSDKTRTDGLENSAKALTADYDIVIMGHSHQPTIKQLNGSIYVNTGYWGTDNSYAEIIDGKVTLLQYKM